MSRVVDRNAPSYALAWFASLNLPEASSNKWRAQPACCCRLSKGSFCLPRILARRSSLEPGGDSLLSNSIRLHGRKPLRRLFFFSLALRFSFSLIIIIFSQPSQICTAAESIQYHCSSCVSLASQWPQRLLLLPESQQTSAFLRTITSGVRVAGLPQ